MTVTGIVNNNSSSMFYDIPVSWVNSSTTTMYRAEGEQFHQTAQKNNSLASLDVSRDRVIFLVLQPQKVKYHGAKGGFKR